VSNAPKIIIGVLANDGPEPPVDNPNELRWYGNMVVATQKTCYSNPHESCKVFYVYANDPHHFRRLQIETPTQWSQMVFDLSQLGVLGFNFYYNTLETRQNILRKTISFFEYCLQNEEFDYIFRCNCGSYIDTNLLYNISLGLSNNKLYYGAIGKIWPGQQHDQVVDREIRYVSGAGMLLSRDVIEHIVQNKDDLEYNGFNKIDDVSIGDLLDRTGYCKPHESPPNVQSLFLSEIISDDFKLGDDCFHYYFKHSLEPKCLFEIHDKILVRSKSEHLL
jgi:hypothetical protein